ncbi:bifunctional helix-turn-helix transcriptional regulator/GNAT family N-acetyltransferase [Sphingomonas sp. BT-65]|uniref:bifunctional helix-turn-helix transcriptional regulator/GNAT family N-acetyltransferase n=1 Tax=Sphingomonas sp. BT-65 TaxID=2989821 RepID=UPI002235B6C9|nr:helix-turn-helix domain-containing GNAT family N-acetyltransferase [Sphingomonas sp. BT-65]MCW4461938.1 bifunctional helix-turn-helix transcriptional regulator/GNAT family N-acetyltransferase [Sphingomonas sp. BT-65]
MAPDAVSRFRRFARVVTREVGALDSSFLGRGRPLGAARVLNAIGAGRSDVAEIRAYLGLDSGLMSRLLRGLEDEGLVRTVPHPDDARCRIATLTASGRQEFEAYEALSDTRASMLLERAADADELLRAMDLIASALGRDIITIEEIDPASDAARDCLERYYAELAARFPTGFEVARSRDPDAADMIRPRGAFLVAMSDGMPVGCVGLKGGTGDTAEIKRLWVCPSARGLGLARKLMTAAEDAARNLSIATLRLDTNRALPEAAKLYRATGWTEIERFNDDPYAEVFFEKKL